MLQSLAPEVTSHWTTDPEVALFSTLLSMASSEPALAAPALARLLTLWGLRNNGLYVLLRHLPPYCGLKRSVMSAPIRSSTPDGFN